MPFLFTPYYLLSIYHLWLELENGQLLNLVHHELKHTLSHRGEALFKLKSLCNMTGHVC
jgi:hypothetical protein